MAHAKLIEIDGLYYTAGNGFEIFEGVDEGFKGGERVAIIGPHRSGKTTLMRLLLGLDMPKKGRICIFGEDTGVLERSGLDRLRQRIGSVFEDSGLISNLKVIENVILPLQYHTDMPDEAALERGFLLLNRVGFKGDVWGLPDPLPPFSKKSIALARAMALDPMIMIYDMVLEGLDYRQTQEILGFIDKFHEENDGRLSIMTFNNERDLKEIPLDRILRIEDKRFVG